MNGYDSYGGDPRGVVLAEGSDSTDGDARVTEQVARPTPTDLREQASRLIEAREEAAALRAAELYLQEADRVFAEAAYEFSQVQRLADQVTRDHAQVTADRGSLARGQRELDQERRELDVMARELALKRDLLAAGEAELAAMENELMARKARQRSAPTFNDSGPIVLKPDPHAARTPADLLECLRAFRVWSGNRSMRHIAEMSGNRISASSVGNILRSTGLPDRLDAIDAVVAGCGGSEEDRAAFATAWRRLCMGSALRS